MLISPYMKLSIVGSVSSIKRYDEEGENEEKRAGRPMFQWLCPMRRNTAAAMAIPTMRNMKDLRS